MGKDHVATAILLTSNRRFNYPSVDKVELGSSISYDKQTGKVRDINCSYDEDDEDTIVITNFCDKLYALFKKDKETWDEEDTFLIKAVSDYLPLAIDCTMKEMYLEKESIDLFHYAFIVPSEWEEEIREDIIRPIFVKSGLISNEDHQDRLLFFSDIESIFYNHSFERGDNTILCRLSPDEEKTVIKFDLIQTTSTLYNVPNASLFPKVMKSSSVSVITDDIDDRITEFLRTNLFYVATDDDRVGKLLKDKLAPFDEDRIIEDVVKQMNCQLLSPLDEEGLEIDTETGTETESWIMFEKSWMLTENQKCFIVSLSPLSVCAEISSFIFGDLKDMISNNSTKSYRFLLVTDKYTYGLNQFEKMTLTWLEYILEYNRRSLNSIVTTITPLESNIIPEFLLRGAGIGIFEAIQHSDMYRKPLIMQSEDLSTSSFVFLNSKPDAIVNLGISLGSTLLTYLLLNEDGLIQQILDHDDLIADKFIPFAERYLLGGLADFTADDGVSIKKDLLFEMKAILTKDLSNGEASISTNKPKYINAFVLMYMIYIKEEILNKLPDHLISDHTDMKIGYAISIETMLLNNTIGTKDSLQDIIFASGLVPKIDDSKKLRITTQGERILPAIQKSLKLELSLKSYFLVCQLHEDYLQLSLHQVVTVPSSEEEEQESIIVQDEILDIPNIYDSLCTSMWHSLVQDSSLIELCKVHNTSDDNKILDLFSSKTKTELFSNLKSHISDNVLQNNLGTQSTTDTNAVKLNSSCNCKVRLTTADIIDVSFTPVLQDIACTLSASLLNKGLFGNYINIDYMFSFIRFNSNPQLQYAFSKILEEEADDFNLELGIDTSCMLVPELFGQLLQPVISQRPLCYKDFEIGALQQVCSENYVFRMTQRRSKNECPLYKSKITDTETIECDEHIVLPFLNKRELINNVRSNRPFYLRNREYCQFLIFSIGNNSPE
ncbi:hypothetical protein HPULCUR_005728 [Helicostylum pulchrum]|uniref:Uncharacterized protein n=1 Tax=Helicostylum pulchrum TaxID=562976 RepID=A0ABP9Y1W5_9FUNG